MLVLLLALHASAEWVEITQHYAPYTESHRSNDNYNTTVKTNWDSKENTQRVNVLNNYKTERTKFPDDIFILEDRNNFDYKADYKPKKEERKGVNQKGVIERVPNTGVIKRVQLNNSPVKSPVLKTNFEEDTRFSTVKPNDKDELIITDLSNDNIPNHPKTNIINRRIYINDLNGQQSAEKVTNFAIKDDFIDSPFKEDVDNKVKYKNYTTVNNIFDPKPTFITATEDFSDFESEEDKRFFKITPSTNAKVTTEKIKSDEKHETINNKEFVTNIEQINRLADHKTESSKTVIDPEIKPTKNRASIIKINALENDASVTDSTILDTKGPNKVPNEKNTVNQSTKDRKTTKTKNKVNTLENLAKFMKLVAETITMNSRKSFGGKMQYLHQLKNSILSNIESHIEAAWPDDSRRQSRAASPRGHVVHFPSSESALMTISFLTFAVFLIKLVLQVIQTYKQKTMMVAPIVVTGRAAFQRGKI